MHTAYFSACLPAYRAATVPIGDIGHIPRLHPDLERNSYPPLIQRYPAKKKSPDKEQRKPQDPEHKVDDYA